MYNHMKKNYFWSGLRKNVEHFVKSCDDCQRYKPSKPNTEPMTITTTASSGFQKIFLDLVGPLPEDSCNNRYIVTLQCKLTKLVEAQPIPNKEAITVAKSFVDNFILRDGIVNSSIPNNWIQQLIIPETIENTHMSLGNYLYDYHQT
ncbi:hypothetical protein JTB14_037009 [Gonioctena quinquepunctata]|nr:hypothetical protein JTB14_037009 [Gonioctena quinquepunctata]